MTGTLSETLHGPLGLWSVCIDFGYFRTSFLESGQRAPKVSRISDYQGLSTKMEIALEGTHTPPLFLKYAKKLMV